MSFIKDIKPFTDNVIISLDIESEGAKDMVNKRIYMIGMKIEISGSSSYRIYKDLDEATLLTNFINDFNKLNDALKAKNSRIIMCGHNIFCYDIPHINVRCVKKNIKRPFKIGDKDYVLLAGGQIKYRYKDIKWPNVDIVDTLFLVEYYDAVKSELSDHTLKTASIELGLRDERRLELSFNQIQQCYIQNKHHILEKYLRLDLDDTMALCKKLLPSYYYQKRLMDISLQQIVNRSTASKINSMIYALYRDRCPDFKFPLPSEQQSFEGAITAVLPGLYTKVIKLDVSSLYPSIMLTYKIFPSKDPKGYFISLLKLFTEERLKYKALSKTDEQAGYISDSYKVLINSFYGMLNSKQPFNDPPKAALVTEYGRKIVNLMYKILKENGCKVLEIDTDGIILSTDKTTSDIQQLVNDQLPKGIKVDVEYEADWAYLYKSKNYMIKIKDHLIKKGKFKKRGFAKILSEFTNNYCNEYVNFGIEKADSYYETLKETIIKGKFELSKLSITRKIAKSEKTLVNLGIGNPGDKVTFYEGYDNFNQQITTAKGPYNVDHYQEVIKNIRAEVLETINGKTKSDDPLPTEYENIFEEAV